MADTPKKKAIDRILEKAEAGDVEEAKKGLLNKIVSWYADENCKDPMTTKCVDDSCRRAFAQGLSSEASVYRPF